jgi:predicted DNA-binding protein (UPF0251 family)
MFIFPRKIQLFQTFPNVTIFYPEKAEKVTKQNVQIAQHSLDISQNIVRFKGERNNDGYT